MTPYNGAKPSDRDKSTMKFPAGAYDDVQLKVLKTAFELACEELGISAGDVESRERIATTLMTLARVGQSDPDKLKCYAVSQFEGRMKPK
jgi:hypothetical protein